MSLAPDRTRGAVDKPATPVAPVAREVRNPCALCNGESRPLFRVDGALVVACGGCGLIRQDTRPSAVADVYDSAYYATDNPKGGYSNYVLDAQVNRGTFRRRLRSIEKRYGRRGRLLDIGAALGDFVREATTAEWTAEGVEISTYAATLARGHGALVHVGPLEKLGLPPASFDVVTLYDTIEHLTDPLATLREIHRLLVPGGLLHLVTPNVGGVLARVLGRRWYHYKPGQHLFYFSPSTLRTAVTRAGLVWSGSARTGSYLTLTYVCDRLRYYSPALFGALARLGRHLRLGPFVFYLHVGEMEAWASRPTDRVEKTEEAPMAQGAS